MKKKHIIILVIVAVIICSSAIGIAVFNMNSEFIQYAKFIDLVDEGRIEEVVIKNEDTLKIHTNDDQVFITNNPLKENFKEFLLLEGINVKSSTGDLSAVLSSLFIVGIFVAVYVTMNKKNGKDKQLVKDVRSASGYQESVINFDNVAGNYEAKDMLKDTIDFIHNPEKYTKVGAKMPRGILLYGPPGTGKTLLARAIAGEANVPFYALSGSDFVQMYVGVGAKRVRELFEKARKSKRAIIFIDEIDALGKSRSSKANSNNDERDQTLNALLTEMSGFSDSDGIVVVGATNRSDILDKALLRPGRFDRQIEVALPDRYARQDIISLYLKNRPVADDVDISNIALKTVMFSGAMLSNLVNESAILAANSDSHMIMNQHVESAFYNVLAGREKKHRNKIMDQEEIKVTAIHEAGHALLTMKLCPDVKIDKITIIPTSNGAAGYNYNIYKDKMYRTKEEIVNSIMVLLGGRAAEEIILGKAKVTSGCVNDIKHASNQIYEYFKIYGMDDEYGIINIETLSDEQILVEKCREKLNELYKESIDVLGKNSSSLKKIMMELLEKETLTGEDVKRIRVA